MGDEEKVKIRKRKRPATLKIYKSVKENDHDSEDESHRGIISETKEAQKSRQRPSGIESSRLLVLEKIETNEAKDDVFDPLKKPEITKDDETKTFTNLKNAFLIATDKKDEDLLMNKYIEEEINKTKKNKESQNTLPSREADIINFLYEVPENLKIASSSKRAEDMLSNQMLTGIPEVSLGIQVKMKNLEEIEGALEAKAAKKTNESKGLTLHDRFDLTEVDPRLAAISEIYLGDDD